MNLLKFSNFQKGTRFITFLATNNQPDLMNWNWTRFLGLLKFQNLKQFDKMSKFEEIY